MRQKRTVKTPRSKTFTGCWTCRRRKKKCDERRPDCLRCEQRGQECEGYGARLQWLPPLHDYHLTSAQDDQDGTGVGSTWQRRGILSAPPLPVLGADELDHILADIDASNVTTQLVLFGVFPCPGGVPDVEHLPAENHAASRHKASSLGPDQHGNVQFASTEQDVDVELLREPCESDDILRDHDSPPVETLVVTPAYPQPNQYILHSQNHALCRESRYLLEHYIHKVVRVFTTIDNPKSPWKIYHVPTVLQTVGELEVSGTASFVKVALLYAVLSVSAFHMANHCVDDSAKMTWNTIATGKRYKATQYLNKAVDIALVQKQPVKYKEMLAAMLTMVTIDVVSGDTDTCILHLDGCESFIHHVRMAKSKYSYKAKALHRHYLYLRTVHDSARLRGASKSGQVGESGLDQVAQVPNTWEGPSIVSTCRVPGAGDDLSWLTVSENSKNDMTACEFVYGVPVSLLMLIRKATAMIQHDVGSQRLARDTGPRSPTYDDVEVAILQWPMEAELGRKAHLFNELQARLVEHQTRAFHQALLIYFAQHYRTLPHQYLRPNVEAALESLEHIEELKHDAGMHCGHNFWPAFVAASEAFDEDLQTRFRAWFPMVPPTQTSDAGDKPVAHAGRS
ncbi:Component of the argr regulatory complex [Teratosphaeria destructans]|uniref:Component of the argr regulatory complex n=1 Tax=Teratosphaeria destructans TaxID=418781 RepID=A0A9W7ST06_9PEZI|nr:Component of the argr regulatory complex [Teratosphaeria destructans]